MKYIFLDTNIFLHCIDFEQIPWNELTNDNEIVIAICDMVIDEIDKQKDGKPGKVKDRAKKISAIFADIFLRGKDSKYSIMQVPSPNIEFLRQGGFDTERQDNIIIATILNFQHRSDSILISRDNGMLLKAKRFNIDFLIMPEKYYRAEEKSEVEKERDKYKMQNETAIQLRPNTSLVFDNGLEEITFEVPDLVDIDDLLSEEMSEIRASHEYVQRKPKNQDISNQLYFGDISKTLEAIRKIQSQFDPLTLVSDERIAEYNKELDDYFVECEKYYRLKIKAELLNKIFKPLNFSIINNGNTPSGDLLITIYLPNDISFYNYKSCKFFEASEPKVPNLQFSHTFNFPNSVTYGMNYNPPGFHIWDKTNTLDISKFETHDCGLMHHCTKDLNIKGSLFIDISEPKSFYIGWSIVDANNPNITEGVLKVNVVKSHT